MSKMTMGRPSCNPSIGGTAKGHLVKEIDALGGAMAILADKAGIHFKMLNRSKGYAVWSPRCQIDKDLYPIYVYQLLSKQENLTIIEATVKQILIKKLQSIWHCNSRWTNDLCTDCDTMCWNFSQWCNVDRAESHPRWPLQRTSLKISIRFAE
jgi:glucose-inhibited division protein A